MTVYQFIYYQNVVISCVRKMNYGTQFRFSDKYCLLFKGSFACTKSSITVLQYVTTGKKT